MAKFHVGQRVRVVDNYFGYPEFIGKTGVISSALRPHMWGLEYGDVHEVRLDDEPDRHTVFKPSHLEPISDSTELGTWEQVQAICGFMPAQVRA